AGYVAYAFDFEGHGQNPVPMSGDVSSIDGTTRLLVNQTRQVIEATQSPDQKTALLGHSMATDLLVRSIGPETGPVVLLSAFSQEITPDSPNDLLLLTGAWEPGLRDFALKALQMVDPAARDGDTATRDDLRRRARIVPYADHVSILHARSAQRAALDWLDSYYGRSSSVTIWPTGWALLVLLGSIVLLAAPLSRLLPQTALPPRRRLGPAQIALLTLLPAIAAPLIAVPLNPGWLPVLVADYLALHLLVFGVVQLALLWRFGVPFGPVSARGLLALLVWGLAVFGLALGRYGINFWPDLQRLWIIAALCLGAVPFMLADALVSYGAPFWQRLLARIGFLASLGLAVALDFQGLFFLLMIAPIIALFYIIFGLMGRCVAGRSGPAAAGLALGIVLAWALGVSFPMFSA
ncbi:MAG: alpha/beta hydrolase, partial [Rhodobacterales bacterium]